jgi:hypothetical protein
MKQIGGNLKNIIPHQDRGINAEKNKLTHLQELSFR